MNTVIFIDFRSSKNLILYIFLQRNECQKCFIALIYYTKKIPLKNDRNLFYILFKQNYNVMLMFAIKKMLYFITIKWIKIGYIHDYKIC